MTNPPAPPAKTIARSAYLVLGMHRSGTSAVTQLLALAGASLPSHVMPGDEHNAKGYFEPWRIAIFNDQQLQAAGSAWDDPFAWPGGPVSAEAAAEALALFRSEFGRTRHPLMKDPRVSLLLPLWRGVLEAQSISARCVIPVRHPLAVAGSLARRDGFPVIKSVLLWTTYMLAAEAGSRDLPRAFVDYDRLLGDWRGEVDRIEACHGASLPRLTKAAAAQIDEFLTPELRHNSGQGRLEDLGAIGLAAKGVYDGLCQAAEGGQLDPRPLNAARALLSDLKLQMGPFVSPVTHALDVARAQLADARRGREFEAGRAAELLSEAEALNAALKGTGAELHKLRLALAASSREIEALQDNLAKGQLNLLEVSHALDAALAQT